MVIKSSLCANSSASAQAVISAPSATSCTVSNPRWRIAATICPGLATLRVEFRHMGREKKGAYSPARNAITLNTGFRGENARKALVHEIQHAIQDIEGFARSGDLRNGDEDRRAHV